MWLIMPSSKDPKSGRRKLQHLCLDKAYISEPEEHKLIKRGYVLHIPTKIKIDEKDRKMQKIRMKIQQQQQQSCLKRKKYSAKRWVVERTNSWHNRFRKLFTHYEKKSENYLGMVQFSCCIIIYRKIILG